jgi:ribonuclease HII
MVNMSLILGIDEVGRGAWAGPLTVGAVVLPNLDSHQLPDGIFLRDSKKLNRRQRQRSADWIKVQALDIGLGWATAGEIDKIGLAAALKMAARRAVGQITANYDQIIIDGTVRLIDDQPVSTIKKADQLVASVSAASIVAKVARDSYMSRLDLVFPNYNFASHVGYGTTRHRLALTKFGISPLHRTSFAPIAEVLAGFPKARPQRIPLVDKTIGRQAEKVAVQYLVEVGHKIIAQNWRTRQCEIDIISIYQRTIFFTEVKYRQSASHGDGLAAITPQKLSRMRFAAKLWAKQHLARANLRLSAISLTDTPPKVENYIASID